MILLTALLFLIVFVLFIQIIVSLGNHLLRSLLLLHLSFLLQDLADHGHFMVLLSRMYVTFKRGICSMHYIPLFYDVVADLSHAFIIFLVPRNNSLLLLSFLINGQDFLLENS